MHVKKNIFNEYVLPVMTYGSEEMMAVVQHKIELIVLGISLWDQSATSGFASILK